MIPGMLDHHQNCTELKHNIKICYLWMIFIFSVLYADDVCTVYHCTRISKRMRSTFVECHQYICTD